MTTSDTTEDQKPLKTDRRTDLSGGLDTRSSVVSSQPNKVTAIGNFRLTKDGSLTKRKGGSQLCKVNPFIDAGATTNPPGLPAPVISDSGGVGTLGAGTYTVKYTLGSVSDSSGPIGQSPLSNALVMAANGQIFIDIPAVNSGGGFGTGAGAVGSLFASDDPFNGGYLFTGTNFVIYAKRGIDALTAQTGVSVSVFTTTAGVSVRRITMSSYSNNLPSGPTNAQVPVPIRALFWHSLIDTTIGFLGTSAFALSGAHTSAQLLTKAKDEAGTLFGFSRMPTKIYATVVDAVMLVADGMGKPKKLDTRAGTPSFQLAAQSTWNFRQMGAIAPAAAPTHTTAAGALNGVYQYAVTFVYETHRQDGTSMRSESNVSATLTTAALVNNTVTITQPAASLEDPGVAGTGNCVAWNLYRTVSGATSNPRFLLLANAPIATTTIVDNNADTLLLTQVPPNAVVDVPPNDPPPYGLTMMVEHQGRALAVQGNLTSTTNNAQQAARVRTTNVVKYSKTRVLSKVVASARITASLVADLANFDAWSDVFLFVICGSFSQIVALKSFRGVLYVFKEDEIGVIEGELDQQLTYRAIWKGSGAMENSIVECGNYLMAFDQGMGPLAVSGYDVTDLGYDTIQQDWLTAVTTTAGEAVSGGGRGTMGCVSAIWDTVQSEVRWVMSDFQTDPTSAYATGTAPTYFEYVCQLPRGRPSGEFTRFTGAVSGTTRDRRINTMTAAIIGTAAIPFRARDVIYGDYHGRVVKDATLGTDLDQVVATPISLRATWPFFFGDNIEMVKLFRFLYLMFQMGSTVADVLTVQCRSLSKGATSPVTMATLNGSAALAGLDQTKRIDVPAQIDATNGPERGISIDIFGTASSDVLNITEMALKYQDVNETRNRP